jgi:hypothetical protein
VETQQISRLCDMLKSGDKEMCNLAVALFCGATKDYADYYKLRTKYDPKSITVHEENARSAFNQMFNNLDKSTCRLYPRMKMRQLRMTSKSSKQKREEHKKNFKTDQWKQRIEYMIEKQKDRFKIKNQQHAEE